MRFLRNVLATLVGLFLFFGLITLIFSGIIAAASSEEEVEVEANSVLKLELTKPIVSGRTTTYSTKYPSPVAATRA